MLKSFVEHKIIAIFVASKSAGGSPRRSINTLKGLYVACTFVVQAITFLNTKGTTYSYNWPLPHPLPRREGRDYRDTPNGLLSVAYGAICGCIIRSSAHFISLFVYIESSVKYVHSIILCLSVIMSITIKNTTQHIHSVILCHFVILS